MGSWNREFAILNKNQNVEKEEPFHRIIMFHVKPVKNMHDHETLLKKDCSRTAVIMGNIFILALLSK